MRRVIFTFSILERASPENEGFALRSGSCMAQVIGSGIEKSSQIEGPQATLRKVYLLGRLYRVSVGVHKVSVKVRVEPNAVLAAKVYPIAHKLTLGKGDHLLPKSLADAFDPLSRDSEGAVSHQKVRGMADNLTGLRIHDRPHPVPKVPIDLDRMTEWNLGLKGLARIRSKGARGSFLLAFHAGDYRV